MPEQRPKKKRSRRPAAASKRRASGESEPRGAYRKPSGTGARGKASSQARKKRRSEPAPVISGRFFIAAALVAPMLIPMSPIDQMVKVPAPEPTDIREWKVGNTAEFSITLITADYDKLACMSDQQVDGKHCEFKSATEAWPKDPADPVDDNRENVIQPYRTWPDNHLVLASGLWAEPAVAMRLHHEPPEGVAPNRLARFVVRCKMKFIGKIDKPSLRWAPGQQWQTEGGSVLVAEPVSCELEGV